MTTTNTTRLVTYTGNGATTVFDYDFLIPADENLIVTLLEIATGVEGDPLSDALYSVTGIADPDGGTVTYPLVGSPLSSDYKINIKRELPYYQELDLNNQSAFFPEELEDQLDNIVMQIQQLAEEVSRSIQTVPGSGVDPGDLVDSLIEAAADAEAAAASAAAAAAAAAASAAAAALFDPANYVAKAGDTMTGNLTIAKATPILSLQAAASGQTAAIYFRTGTSIRWLFYKGGGAESGANAGSDVALVAHDDSGATLGTVFSAVRSTQIMTITQTPLHPTASAGDSTTKSATTAFVDDANKRLRGGNPQTGTTYAFTATDLGKIVTGNNGSAQTFTINTGIFTTAYEFIEVLQLGAGQISIAAGGGMTVNPAASLKLRAQYSAGTLLYLGSNTCVWFGDITS